jgi:hypothetical protein
MRLRNGRLVGAAGLLACSPVWAQDAPRSDVEVFEPGYFARFNPANASDMVRQIPGFSLEDGDDVRGFAGAAGNVLINGERPSTKTSLRQFLGRIPVARVERIEIVTGASAGLDMRGQTKIANVILRASTGARTGNWQTVARIYRGGRVTADVEGSLNTIVFGGELNLAAEVGQSETGGPGGGTRARIGREFYDASIRLFEAHAGRALNERVTFEPSVDFERDFGWGTLRLNGAYEDSEYDGSRFYEVFAPDFDGSLVRLETQDSAAAGREFELGGDVEIPLSPSVSLKLITVNERGEGTSDNLFGFFSGAGAFRNSTRVQSDDSAGESIIRGQVNWQINDAHAIEVGLEGAYNFLDSARRVTLDTGVDATPPGSDTIVEEQRAEAIAAYVWKPSPSLTLEPAFRFEYSRIEQEARLAGGSSLFQEREFTYPKPAVTATWTPATGRQLRASVQRSVSQLNFGDFVSSVEVNNERVQGGNAGLQPARSWDYALEFEQSFWGDGVLTLSAEYGEVEDVIDVLPVIPLGGTLSDAFDGVGNIGDGTIWTIGVQASIPLKPFGLTGARLDVELNSGSSEVVDPTTGVTREFSDEFNRNWSVEYRHDLPAQKLSYGFEFGESGGATAYRLRETFKRRLTGGNLRVFVETTRVPGLNIRVGVNDTLDPAFISYRAIYDGPRSTGNLVQFRQADARNGPMGFIRVSGSF